MKRRRHSKLSIFLIVLVLLSVGYAFISSTINIGGIGGINKNTWKIEWDSESVEVTSGSTSSTEPIVNNEKTSVAYAAELSLPGDFYEFTIDAVNRGTIDGVLSVNALTPVVYDKNGQVTSLPEGVIYTIKYADGGELKKNHLLKKNEREKYRVRIEFDKDAEDPLDDAELRVETTVPYEQTNDDAIDRDTEKYTITFNPNGGSVSPTTKKVVKGLKIGELPVPTREGYTFDGWYTDSESGTKITEDTVPTGNDTYYAHWSVVVNKYTITFNPNDGEVSPTSKEIDEGAAVGELPVPTRSGYSFDGWFTLPQDGIRVTEETIPTGDVTYYAHWTQIINKYTITFNPNGGKVVPTSKEINQGSAIGEMPTPTWDGHTFDGWFTDQTEGEEVTEETVPTGNDTYYAHWSITPTVKYTITLNPGDGTVSPTSIEVDAGTAIGDIPTPTRTGYTFLGWWTDLETGEMVDSTYEPTGDMTLYAKWNNFPYVFRQDGACTFGGSDGTITGAECSDYVGRKYIDTGVNLYNTTNHDKDYEIGFTIVSYNPSDNVKQATLMNTKLEGNNYPGLVFRRLDNTDDLDLSSRNTSSANERVTMSYSENMDVKIYRIKNKTTNVQEIFYSINDGEQIKVNDLSQFNPEFNLSVWFGATPTNVAATAAQRYFKGTLSNMYIKLGTYEEDNRYIINFNPNEGEVSPTIRKIDRGNPIGELPVPTRKLYTFDGWYTGLTDGIKISSSTIPNDNTTYYAHWTKLPTYTLSFVTGEGSSVADIEILQGEPIGELPTPSLEGYKFKGWYTDQLYTIQVTEETVPTGNETYYAKWEELLTCPENDDRTIINQQMCPNNINQTISSGKVCKRAETLHQSKCNMEFSSDWWCEGNGYEIGSTITYGQCGTSGNLNTGDAFTCDVNGDGKFDELYERFYYVSDYYNTHTGKFEDDTAVLIYYNSVISGIPCNKIGKAYDTTNDSWYGPRYAMTQLPSASKWNNVSLKNTERKLTAEIGFVHDADEVWGGSGINYFYPLPENYSYAGYSSRLLTAREVMKATGLTEVAGGTSDETKGSLDNYNFFFQNTYYEYSKASIYGTWLENPARSHTVLALYGNKRTVNTTSPSSSYSVDYIIGIKPTIEVPKTSIEYGGSEKYVITFEENGGRSSLDSKRVDIGSPIESLPTATKENYNFDGWYTGLTDGIKVTESYIPQGNIKLYARWANACGDFQTASWNTILNTLETNPSAYSIGCTKEIDMGTYGTHKIRLANKSTNSICSTEGFSQTACGLVIEFADIITSHRMNPLGDVSINGYGNKGGWEYSEMRQFVNNDIYNALPNDLKNIIIDTKVISGRGYSDQYNYVTTDKIYLLSPTEVWGEKEYYDYARDNTRQLDYYYEKEVSFSNYGIVVKKYENKTHYWWLRSAVWPQQDQTSFFNVSKYGRNDMYESSDNEFGVTPAFRIG